VSKTTTNLQLPSPRDWRDLPVPVAIAICLFALLAIFGLVGRMRGDSGAASVPTPQLPIIMIATAPVEPLPTPVAMIAVQPPIRYVVAFAAPDGDILGPIPAPPASAVLARYGSAWVLVPWESGQVWLRAADVGLPDVADLAPPAPAVVYIASQPAEAAPTLAAPAQTDVPPAAAPVVWATSGPIRKEDFTQPDPKAHCAFVGCLGR
jgi:hypothetical protein